MTPQDATEVVPYLTSAATIVFIQKWLKTRPAYIELVAAIPVADKWIHWTVAGVASLIAAMGIHLTWNWDPSKGGAFSGNLPSLMDMLHGLGDWYKVYILQHTGYEMVHRPPAPDPPAPLYTKKELS